MYRVIAIILSFLFFVTILISCSKLKTDYTFLNSVDTIKIFYNVTDSSFKPIVIPLDKRHCEFFKTVLNSKPENSNCQANETIKFYSKSKEVFKLDISINDNSEGCQFLILVDNDRKHYYRLTYNLGMFLSESLK